MEERTLCSIWNENVSEERKGEEEEEEEKKQKDSQSNAQESRFFSITLEKKVETNRQHQTGRWNERASARARERVKREKSVARHSIGCCDLFHLTYSINHGREHRRAGKYACAIKHNERAGNRHGKDTDLVFSSCAPRVGRPMQIGRAHV